MTAKQPPVLVPPQSLRGRLGTVIILGPLAIGLPYALLIILGAVADAAWTTAWIGSTGWLVDAVAVMVPTVDGVGHALIVSGLAAAVPVGRHLFAVAFLIVGATAVYALAHFSAFLQNGRRLLATKGPVKPVLTFLLGLLFFGWSAFIRPADPSLDGRWALMASIRSGAMPALLDFTMTLISGVFVTLLLINLAAFVVLAVRSNRSRRSTR